MRWLCILLLVANVGYFGWELNQRLYSPAENQPTLPPPLPAGVPKLKLLSELEQLPPTRGMLAEPASSGAGTGNAEAGAPPPGASQSASTASNAEASPPVASEAAAKAQPPSTQGEAPDTSGASNPEVATVDKKEEPEKPAEETAAKSASVAAAAPRAEASDTTPEDSGAAAPSPVPEHCLRVGPFDSEAKAGGMRDRVAKLADRVSVAKTSRQEQKFYWVYIEPVTSDAKARETLEDLKSKGIKDLFMIRKGEMKNAISLGVFRSQDSVRNRLAELKNNGYQPLVVPRYETRTEYWLDLRGKDEKLSKEALEKALPEAVKVAPMDCSATGPGGAGEPSGGKSSQ